MIVVVSLFGILLCFGIIEYAMHRKRLRTIPLRIHVNGTRGKSITTRLIAAGLRAGGLRVIAKTTGSAARIIHEDGHETSIVRKGDPRIIEQVGIISYGYKKKVDAVVLECMAIQPEMQWCSEQRIVQSHIGIITNIRLDHTDQMGQSLKEIASCLALTIPCKGTLITSQHHFLDLYKKRADAQQSALIVATEDSVSDQEMATLHPMIFKESVALSLAACECAGINRSTALQGMSSVVLDYGSCGVYSLKDKKKKIYLINAFAANDPESTLMIFNRISQLKLDVRMSDATIVGLLNHRLDRGYRLPDLCRHFVSKIKLHSLYLIGQSSFVSARLQQKLINQHSLTIQKKQIRTTRAVHSFIESISLTSNNTLILFGFGNIKGDGQLLLDYFKTRGTTVV